MKSRHFAAGLAALIAATAVAPTVVAQDRDRYHWDGDNNNGWDPADHYDGGRHHERRLGRDDRVYRGHDGRYYCRRSDGTTGLVIGAIGGGILGSAIGGDTLGTVLGAGSGALLGRSIDRSGVRCR